MRVMLRSGVARLDRRLGLRARRNVRQCFISGTHNKAGGPECGLINGRCGGSMMPPMRKVAMCGGFAVFRGVAMMAMMRSGMDPSLRNVGGRKASHDDGQNDGDT